MIDYVEIRDPSTRQLIGICDTAKSVIWQAVYFGVGEFEIYAPATLKNRSLLKDGYFVTRTNDINCGIIDNIEITDNPQDGMMIVASGKFAKNILSQRIIYRFVSTYSITAATLYGNVASECWRLIDENCGAAAPTYRQFPKFGRGTINDLPAVIVDDNGNNARKQVTYDSLLEYTDALLQEYGYGAYVWLDNFTGELLYVMYNGADRSADNTDGNTPIIFSPDFDNLLSTEYTANTSNNRTTAIIGGQGEGLERFVTLIGDNVGGYARRELWVDKNGVAKTVKNESDEEITYTDAEYNNILITEGKKALSEYRNIETFRGEMDLNGSRFVYGTDFTVGDIVTIENKRIGKQADCRILSATEVQDENGYNISCEYETIGGGAA